MYQKIFHATHPDMMTGASNQQLRDRYLIGDLFVSDVISLNYSHNERFVVGGAMAWDPLESTCRHASLSIL